MNLSRREFLKAAAAATVLTVELSKVEKAVAGNGDTPVIWLQGSGCTGCSVSFLNSIYYATVDDLLLNTLSVEYHPNVSAAAGDFAISAASLARPSTAEIAQISREWLGNSDLQMDLNADGNNTDWLDYALMAKRGYVLVVEGAIPTGSGGLVLHGRHEYDNACRTAEIQPICRCYYRSGHLCMLRRCFGGSTEQFVG